MSEEVKVVEIRKYKGKPILYDPVTRKFSIELDVNGKEMGFTASSEIQLLKLVDKELKSPPIKAIFVGSWRVTRPLICNLIVIGSRVFTIDKYGKKKRVTSDNYVLYDEVLYKELCGLYKQTDSLESQWDRICNRKGKLSLEKMRKLMNLE